MAHAGRAAEVDFGDVRLADVKPLRDRIAEMVRESIIDGKIRPGERLVEPDLAGRLGVSRTPLAYGERIQPLMKTRAHVSAPV